MASSFCTIKKYLIDGGMAATQMAYPYPYRALVVKNIILTVFAGCDQNRGR